MTHLFLLNPNVRLDLKGELQVDTDGDGIPDLYEWIYGYNLARVPGHLPVSET
jgi:hypothetical protein